MLCKIALMSIVLLVGVSSQEVHAESTSTTTVSSSNFLKEFIRINSLSSKKVYRDVTKKDIQLHVISSVSSKPASINAEVTSNTYNIDFTSTQISKYISTSTRDYNIEKKYTISFTKSGDKKINVFSEVAQVRGNKVIEGYIKAGKQAIDVAVPDSTLKLLSDFDRDLLTRFIAERPIKISKNIDDQTLITKITDPRREDFLMKLLLSTVYLKHDFGIDQYEYTDTSTGQVKKTKTDYVQARHIQLGISIQKLKEAILKIYRSDMKPKGMTKIDYVRLINFLDSDSFTNLAGTINVDFWINPKTYEILRMNMPSTTFSYQDELGLVAATIDFDISDKRVNQVVSITRPVNSLDYSILKKKIDLIVKAKKLKKTSKDIVR
jgi:hypothetical protein